MVIFDEEKMLILKKMIYKHTGQKLIVRDEDLLDSAIKSPFQICFGTELYPSVEEKAARMCFNIITSHPFIDGNKRVGILTMLSFLKINQINLKYTDEQLINVGLALASGKMEYEQLVSWVVSHKCKMSKKKESCLEK